MLLGLRAIHWEYNYLLFRLGLEVIAICFNFEWRDDHKIGGELAPGGGGDS